jgi:hypothetical protein
MLRSISEWERNEAGAIEQASAEANGSFSLGHP